MLHDIGQAHYFSGTGQHNVGDAANVVGVETGENGGFWVYGFEEHTPAKTSQEKGQQAQQHGGNHVLPPALLKGLGKLAPVYVLQAKVNQDRRNGRPEHIRKDALGFLLHTYKVSGKLSNYG